MAPKGHQEPCFLLSFFATMLGIILWSKWLECQLSQPHARLEAEGSRWRRKVLLPAEWKQSARKLHKTFLLNSHCPEFYPGAHLAAKVLGNWSSKRLPSHTHKRTYTPMHTDARTHTHKCMHIFLLLRKIEERNVSSLPMWNTGVLFTFSPAHTGCTTMTGRCISTRDLRPREKVFLHSPPHPSPLFIP